MNKTKMKNDSQIQKNDKIPFYPDRSIDLMSGESEERDSNFFHLFYISINDLWDYFITTSFFPTYFYENCKVLNNNKLDNSIKLNDIIDLHFQDKNINIKVKMENIIDTPNYKSYTQSSIEVPEGISPFSITISLYLCSVHQSTGVNLEINSLENDKNTFVYDYILNNYKKIYKNIEKYFEKNFQDYEQSESISIEKSSEEVFNFLINNNFTNLKILLGNNASVKSTNKPNEIEVEHFTKNNTTKLSISYNKDFNEINIFLHFISSTKPIQRQNICLKIININKNSCLFFFTHHIKQFLDNDSLYNYSFIKQKTLWLLKSTIENNTQ